MNDRDKHTKAVTVADSRPVCVGGIVRGVSGVRGWSGGEVERDREDSSC